MVRPLGCCIVCLILAAIGCNRPSNGIDPFLGRTTILAPGTGTSSDPYYPGSGPVYPPPVTTPPNVQFPPAVGTGTPMPTTGTPSLQQPPGGYQNPPPASYYRGTSNESPVINQNNLTEFSGGSPRLQPPPQFDTTPLGSNPPNNATNMQSVVVIDGTQNNPQVHVSHNGGQGQPLALASNVRLPTPQPSRPASSTRFAPQPQPTIAAPQVALSSSTVTGPVLRGTSETTDLADLPPVHSSVLASAQPSGGATAPNSVAFNAAPLPAAAPPLSTQPISSGSVRAEATGNVNLAGYEEPVQTSPQAGNYGRAADYSWLKGRLEYSAARKEWKLRYLRIDTNESDQYGGSVVLSGANQLQSFQPGEYVTVHGRIAGDAATSGSFAPMYGVTRAEKQ